MQLKPNWYHEVIYRGYDTNVGAGMLQLTSAAVVSHDIYCEERYTSADGTVAAFLRSPYGTWPEDLWLCHLRTHEVALACRHVVGIPTSNLFNDALYFPVAAEKSDRLLMRLDLKTFELNEMFDLTDCPVTRWHTGTISPDGRWYVGKMRVSDTIWGLYRIDLERGTWEPFHEHADISNPHPQFEPARGEDILIQLNCGSVIDDEENTIRQSGADGAKLYVIDRDGGNLRMLPVGKPYSDVVTGHECWVGDTGQVLLTTNDRGIYLVRPGDTEAQLLWKGLSFSHISASVDGKYFVVDDLSNGKLYVGSLTTGRMLCLCDTGASCSNPQPSHPHAYMTPDNRYVIFNSDRTGLPQLCAVHLPDGFLGLLDLPVPASRIEVNR